MENITQVSDKWTKFTKELIDSTDKMDNSYPITFNAKDGVISLIKLEVKKFEEVVADLGSKETRDKFSLSAYLGTYEWEEENPVTKTVKTKQIKLVNLPKGDIVKLFEEAIKVAEIWEAFRKMILIQIMSRPEVNRLNIPGTGILLADQLTNKDGISKDLDSLIKKFYNGNPNTFNSIVRDYDSDKFAMSVKDRMISRSNAAFVESLKEMIKELKTHQVVTSQPLDKTDITPVMAKQQDEVIRPITAIGDGRRSKGFSSIL